MCTELMQRWFPEKPAQSRLWRLWDRIRLACLTG
jgi:hypothetical protein